MKIIVIRKFPKLTVGMAYDIIDAHMAVNMVSVVNDVGSEVKLILHSDCVIQINDKNESLSSGYLDMKLSYIEAIYDCGGSVSSIVNRADSMSVTEMLKLLGPNRVRFVTKELGECLS